MLRTISAACPEKSKEGPIKYWRLGKWADATADVKNIQNKNKCPMICNDSIINCDIIEATIQAYGIWVTVVMGFRVTFAMEIRATSASSCRPQSKASRRWA